MTPVVSQYTIGHPRDFAITVEKTNWERDLWAVRQGKGVCLCKDGSWDFEPSPSNRDDKFLEETRFSLETALELATNAYKERTSK
jgi:hypothetical protein